MRKSSDRGLVAVVALGLTVSLSGCGRPPMVGPPDLRANQDTCHECGMTVSDVRHAAAVVAVRDGLVEQFVFDDTGEMLEFVDPAGVTEVRRYVHDFGTEEWIDAAGAYFVKAADVHTPMASGVVAYATEADARAAATRYRGEVLGDRPGMPVARMADAR